MIGYKLVADITVSTATTSVNFTGLNITKDEQYILVSDIVNGSGASSYYDLFVNANTAESNYYRQFVASNSSSVSSSRGNNAEFMGVEGSSKVLSVSNISITNNGYFTFFSKNTRSYGGSYNWLVDYVGVSKFTLTNITSLTITGSNASCIGVGSRFRLYKLTAKKVADIVIETAKTQVDITGLNLDKNSEYLLVSDIYVAGGSNTAIGIFANANLTDSNYYDQYLWACDASMSADRHNNSAFTSVDAYYRNLVMSNIKLTNSGYFCVQTKDIRRYATQPFDSMNFHVTSSTFTMSSITSITLMAKIANAISTGSRFQLYKLK